MIRRPDAPRFRSRALLIAVGYSAFFCWLVCESRKANRADATPAARGVKLPVGSAGLAALARSERRRAADAEESTDGLRKKLEHFARGSAEYRSYRRLLRRAEEDRDRATEQAERFEILAEQAKEREHRAEKAQAAKDSGRL